MFDLSILSDFWEHIIGWQDLNQNEKLNTDIGINSRNGINWNTFRNFYERNNRVVCVLLAAHVFCMVRLTWTCLYPFTELLRFQVFRSFWLQHCSSCCRAWVVWLVRTLPMECYVSVPASRNSVSAKYPYVCCCYFFLIITWALCLLLWLIPILYLTLHFDLNSVVLQCENLSGLLSHS